MESEQVSGHPRVGRRRVLGEARLECPKLDNSETGLRKLMDGREGGLGIVGTGLNTQRTTRADWVERVTVVGGQLGEQRRSVSEVAEPGGEELRPHPKGDRQSGGPETRGLS